MSERRASVVKRRTAQVAQNAPLFDADSDPLEVCSNYIGVYWTFPAPGRYGLPSAADEAAKRSYTIAQQRERASEVARLWDLKCVAEYPIQFNEPDLSDEDRARLGEIETICKDGDTVVLLTKFTMSHNWRPNTVLHAKLRNTGAPIASVLPSGEVIDHFSIHQHWDDCRRQIRKAKRTARETYLATGRDPSASLSGGRLSKVVMDRFYEYLACRLNEIRDLDALDNGKIAGRLNGMGLYTLRGHKWDADAVRSLRATLATRAEQEAQKSKEEYGRAVARRKADHRA